MSQPSWSPVCAGGAKVKRAVVESARLRVVAGVVCVTLLYVVNDLK